MEASEDERLSGLCRLWRIVKFFHPWHAYRAIDWDAALITAIPRVMAAASTDDYQQTLDDFLAVLGDPLTRTVAPSATGDTATPAGAADTPAAAKRDPHLRWTEDGMAVLVVGDFQENDWLRQVPLLDRICGEAGAASALVLDLRGAFPVLCSLLTERLGAFLLRGYPHGTAWHVAPRLTERPVVAARFRRPQVSGRQLQGWYGFDQWTPTTDKWRYTGRVVVLIDEQAGSQAEHTCLFLEAATKATFVGSATAGVNSDVSRVALPGGIGVIFSGHDIRHADGRQLQRMGIPPDIEVHPTIAGLRAGRDEVLEAAARFSGTLGAMREG